MSRLLIVALLCAAVAAQMAFPVDQEMVAAKVQFEQYKVNFKKAYESEAEEETRFAIFAMNLKRVEELRARHGPNTQFGITQFSDMTHAEWRDAYLNFRPQGPRDPNVPVARPSRRLAPSQVDWRSKGKVTPVKNQGQCGSCWAFSATEELESAWAMQTSQLVVLSEQQTVSCDTTDAGCGGGDTITAYQYIQGANGVTTEANYPYTSGDTGDSGTCMDKKNHVLTVANYSYATPGCQDACDNQNEKLLCDNVAQYGPASICVYATDAWQLYTSGVLTSDCSHAYTDLNHCVQLVGYNKAANPPYYIVRNSWDTTWGVDGYIYIGIGQNLCGIADEATFVTAAKAK